MKSSATPTPALRSAIDPMNNDTPAFTRELRYIVVKITDANKHLSEQERDTLERLAAKCGLGRIDSGKRNLECVVVESDWPEYGPTWAAIEARMTGATPFLAPAPVEQAAHQAACEILDLVLRDPECANAVSFEAIITRHFQSVACS